MEWRATGEDMFSELGHNWSWNGGRSVLEMGRNSTDLEITAALVNFGMEAALDWKWGSNVSGLGGCFSRSGVRGIMTRWQHLYCWVFYFGARAAQVLEWWEHWSRNYNYDNEGQLTFCY